MFYSSYNFLKGTLYFIKTGKVDMIYYCDFFSEGYKYKRYKDVYSLLNSLGLRAEKGM